jgi:hypothetical protein
MFIALNAVTAQIRLTNKSVKTISRIFVYLIREIYIQLAWRIFSRPQQYPYMVLYDHQMVKAKRFGGGSVIVYVEQWI